MLDSKISLENGYFNVELRFFAKLAGNITKINL